MKIKVKKFKIKKGDSVVVIAGKDKGKTGRVERVLPKEGKVVIEGINLVKKHIRPSQKNPKGGIIEIVKPIDVSNIMVRCSKCNKPTRIGYKILERPTGSPIKKRICRKCGEEL